jgi:hypothetical protein
MDSFAAVLPTPGMYEAMCVKEQILCLQLTIITVRDTAQESVMNALGYSLFHDVVNQTKKITTISTMQINHLGDVPKDSITR